MQDQSFSKSPAATDPTADEIVANVLHRLSLVDSPPEPGFNRFTRLASRVADAPIALVSFVEERCNRQFFKAAKGLPGGVRQTDLDRSFCKFVSRSGEMLAVSDAREDARFADNPIIEEMGVIAYLGAPISGPGGARLGSLCAIDREPRTWSDSQKRLMTDLATCLSEHIALREKRAA